jgi:hypothetical protein
MNKQAIHSDQAPAAIGTYSQAIRVGDLVFLSGQIPLDPATMEVVDGDFEARARRSQPSWQVPAPSTPLMTCASRRMIASAHKGTIASTALTRDASRWSHGIGPRQSDCL